MLLPRIDQKTCVKCITAAGLTPVVVGAIYFYCIFIYEFTSSSHKQADLMIMAYAVSPLYHQSPTQPKPMGDYETIKVLSFFTIILDLLPQYFCATCH